MRTQLHRGLRKLRARLEPERRVLLGGAGLAAPGLAAVRAHRLAVAQAQAGAAAAASTAAVGAGALLMSKKILAAAAALIVVLGAGGYLACHVADRPGPSGPPARSTAAVVRRDPLTSGAANPGSEEVHLRGRAVPPSRSVASAPRASSRVAPRSGVRVRVVDEEGHGVSGVLVNAKHLLAGANIHAWVFATSSATGADGTCRLEIEGPRHLRVEAQSSPQASASLPLDVPDGGREVTLEVARRARVGGRVVDPEGRGVPAIPIQARWKDGIGAGGVSGPDGAFRLRVAPGVRRLSIQAGTLEGHAGEAPGLFGDVLRDIAPETRDLVLRLRRPATIQGCVIGSDGVPLRSGSVYALRVGEGGTPTRLAVGIDGATGRFRIGPLRSGAWDLVALPSNARYVTQDATRVVAPDVDAVVICAPAQELRGRLRGEDVERFQVICVDDGHPLGPQPAYREVTADGTFAIPRLRAAPHRLYVRRRGDARAAVRRAVMPGVEYCEIDLCACLAIRGRCRNGRPTEGSRVLAERDAIQVDALIAGDGSFVVSGLMPGPWRLCPTVKLGSAEMTVGPGVLVEAGETGVVIGN